MKLVVGDIGGTHARFAFADLRPGAAPMLGPVHKYRTAEHDGLASAWAAFGREHGGNLPRAAALAVAAPIEGPTLRFMNSDWVIDRDTIAGELCLDDLLLLNDFGAVAHAVSVLEADELLPLAGPPRSLNGDEVTTVLGPGTGLGVSLIVRREQRIEVVETEGGHVAFAPRDDDERRVEQAIRAVHGRCSVERIVSGPGLVAIHAALNGGATADPAVLWSAALAGTDAAASTSLDLFVGAFGAAAGDLSLAHGAMSVVIAGGLANRLRDRLAAADFRDRFTAKGRYRERMERVSVMLATHPEPGLLGAAVAFQRR